VNLIKPIHRSIDVVCLLDRGPAVPNVAQTVFSGIGSTAPVLLTTNLFLSHGFTDVNSVFFCCDSGNCFSDVTSLATFYELSLSINECEATSLCDDRGHQHQSDSSI